MAFNHPSQVVGQSKKKNKREPVIEGKPFPASRIKFSEPITKDILIVGEYLSEEQIEAVHRMWVDLELSYYWYPTSNVNTSRLRSDALSTPYLPAEGTGGVGGVGSYKRPHYDGGRQLEDWQEPGGILWTRHILGKIYDQVDDFRKAKRIMDKLSPRDDEFINKNLSQSETSSEASSSSASHISRDDFTPSCVRDDTQISASNREEDLNSSFLIRLNQQLQSVQGDKSDNSVIESPSLSYIEEEHTPTLEDTNQTFIMDIDIAPPTTLPDSHYQNVQMTLLEKIWAKVELLSVGQAEIKRELKYIKRANQRRGFNSGRKQITPQKSPRKTSTPKSLPKNMIANELVFPLDSAEKWANFDQILKEKPGAKEDFKSFLEKYAPHFQKDANVLKDMLIHKCLNAMLNQRGPITFAKCVNKIGTNGKFKLLESTVAKELFDYVHKQDERYDKTIFYTRVEGFRRAGISEKYRRKSRAKNLFPQNSSNEDVLQESNEEGVDTLPTISAQELNEE